MNGLTARQEAILYYIDRFTRENGFPPSIREIGGNFRIAAPSALEHLKALEKKCYIRRHPMKSRCLEILKKPESNGENHG